MCEGSRNPELEQAVFALVSEQRAGGISRRAFLRRAAALLGGAAAANGLWLAANGAPIPEVAAAMGILQAQAPTTPTAIPNSDIITASIALTDYGSDGLGYLARPTTGGPFPAVAVIQEWWGIDDHIKSVVGRFAKAGFAAIAPDLYRGAVATEPTDAQRLVMTVQTPQALKDIQTAVNYLIGQPFVAPQQAGIVGFCFGGGLAMRMAYSGQHVGAIATFYGAGVNPSDADLKAIAAPVIGFYGGKDTSIPPDQIKHWYATLASEGKIAESHIYPDAMHAFFNDTRSSYNPAAAQDAWPRVLAWFRQYIPVEQF